MNLEEKNVAVFIDAENVSHNDIPYILMEVKKFGRLIVSRLYADWSTQVIERWKQYLTTYALEPVHCAKLPKKNSVDIKMIDDIYDILYFKKTVDIYVLVSNDIDYLTCSRKIKLFGKYLITFGYGNCSELLKNVSDKFVNISLLNMQEDSIENKELLDEKEKLDLDNVFGDVVIEVRKVGDKFTDTIFEVMGGKKHKILSEVMMNMEQCGYDMEDFEEIIKKSEYFRIGISKNKKKLYDITSIDSEVHKTIDEQINAVYQLNDTNELMMAQLKEKMVFLSNNFDQRMWGFNRFKDMINILFNGKLEVIERGQCVYVKNLMS